ncbi:MAG: transcription antitermination factor NusB [Victivallaceae bacterium]|jgi:16S rRNA (cytosine967-C5)-methyltransferase|nr:transcription antitermination factor NusB [Victivallaceae bacterium]MDD3703034.1 transcription antitermination factor NusB [Victivallaceae bacterium]MDD4316902.1 transcription antitermination factor NusB [Victivallaceae bacterium]MDD5662710.1 transcription antitermination factor NusB [Victivallaceae bacterium]NLK82573.1 hypothetical protein [Lentisphaerota bacterium]
MNNQTAEKILGCAIDGLAAAESDYSNIDDYLDSRLAEPGLRRSVSSILFEYYRHKNIVDSLLNSLIKKPCKSPLRYLLCVAATQMLYQDGIASASAVNVAVSAAKKHFGQHSGNFVNGVLRNLDRIDVNVFCGNLDSVQASNLPSAIYRHWQKIHPDYLDTLIDLLKRRAPFTFRACGAALSESESASVEAVPISAPGFYFYLTNNPGLLFKSNMLADGRIYIQDPATALAPVMSAPLPTEKIIDLCAAPGGKTLMLAELIGEDGNLIAVDRSEIRQKITAQNLLLRGHQFPVITTLEFEQQRNEERFDLILVDAPCSNTGVFHRRPDVLWRFSPKKLNELVKIQMLLLKYAAGIITPSGRIVYSTCSIEPAENHTLVAEFIKTNPEFNLNSETQLMPCSENDGAYAAVLKREPASGM